MYLPSVSTNPSGAVVAAFTPNLSSVDLIPGESFLFLWDYTIDGTADTRVDFSNFATGLDTNNNLVQSNTAFDSSILREDESGDTSSEPPIVLTQDLLSRPEMFSILPRPFGDGAEKAIWVVNVVNPTGQDMYVSQVVMSLFSPRGNSLDRVFSASPGSEFCDPETISPTPDQWDCPENNVLVWKDLVNPAQIPPPTVTTEQMYVMYILANGKTDTEDVSLGALTEAVLKVTPP